VAWIDACGLDDIDREDVMRLHNDGRAFAVYHGVEGLFYRTDGLCPHERVHLADGLVMDFGIECPRHNGRFDYRTNRAKRAPVCIDLQCYPARVEGGRVMVDLP
jgi:3-phenylpropionate/trans-cinnamate dioxygenase ferredoxin component